MSTPADPGVGLPPPLPGVQQRPAGNFVSVMAWVSIALGLLGMLYGAMQVLMGLFLPADFYLRMLNPYGGQPPPMPPLIHWLYTHTLMMGVLTLIMSVVLAWVSWGLLKRREWGRKGFIALLVLGTLGQLASIGLLPGLLEATLAMQAGALPPGQPIPPVLEDMMAGVMLVGGLVALVFAAVHVWIIWKLRTPAVRSEFTASR